MKHMLLCVISFKLRANQALDLLSTKNYGCQLVPVKMKYAKSILEELASEITRYMVPALVDNIAQVHKFIEKSQGNTKSQTEYILAILKNGSNDSCGVSGLHTRKYPVQPELEIWIKKSAQIKKLGKRPFMHLPNGQKKTSVSRVFFIYAIEKTCRVVK